MNRREAQKAETIATIKAVAKIMFDAYGYDFTTVRRIADSARMSTGALFAHWTGKPALWTDVMGYPPPSDGALYRCADAVVNALAEAAEQFRFYQAQHEAKGTPEADAKAEVNRSMAERYEALVVAARTPLPFERKVAP